MQNVTEHLIVALKPTNQPVCYKNDIGYNRHIITAMFRGFSMISIDLGKGLSPYLGIIVL